MRSRCERGHFWIRWRGTWLLEGSDFGFCRVVWHLKQRCDWLGGGDGLGVFGHVRFQFNGFAYVSFRINFSHMHLSFLCRRLLFF